MSDTTDDPIRREAALTLLNSLIVMLQHDATTGVMVDAIEAFGGHYAERSVRLDLLAEAERRCAAAAGLIRETIAQAESAPPPEQGSAQPQSKVNAAER